MLPRAIVAKNRTQFGFAGGLIEPVQRVEAPQIEGDHGLEAGADGVQAAHHAGPQATSSTATPTRRYYPKC